MDRDELAVRCLRFAAADGEHLDDHPDLDAWMQLSSLAITIPKAAIPIIQKIVQLGPTEAQASVVAAGPFEDVLIHLGESGRGAQSQEIEPLMRILGQWVWTGRMDDETRAWFVSMMKKS